jgi:hypothetical protein
MTERSQKITFAERRESGVRGILIPCADYRCSHSIAVSGDSWPDDVGLSDIEPRFVFGVCGKRGADVRPDFQLEPAAASRDGLSLALVAHIGVAPGLLAEVRGLDGRMVAGEPFHSRLPLSIR